MAEYIIQDTTLINIANAIRSKTGKSNIITPIDMVEEINMISGAIEDISTEAEMDANLVLSNLGKAYKYIGTEINKYTPGDIYIVEEK